MWLSEFMYDLCVEIDAAYPVEFSGASNIKYISGYSEHWNGHSYISTYI